MTGYMIDTNVIDLITEGQKDIEFLKFREILTTQRQKIELKNMPDAKQPLRLRLLETFAQLDQVQPPSESFVWGLTERDLQSGALEQNSSG